MRAIVVRHYKTTSNESDQILGWGDAPPAASSNPGDAAHAKPKGRRLMVAAVGAAAVLAVAFALFNLQNRGRMMVSPNDVVYEGMVVGIHSRGNDLVVNPLKAKQLTNIRAAGSDENILLTPPVRHSLEQALEFIEDDELVEVTPENIRLRKKLLKEHERRRAGRI